MKILVLASALVGFLNVEASPKKYVPESEGFQPSNLRYYETNLVTPKTNNSRQKDLEAKDSSDRLQRFGYISSFGDSGSGGSGGGNYGHTGIGATQMKIDIGGVALGALIGLGAILIIPKLAHVFSGGHGYRSLDDDLSPLSDVLAKIDNVLEENHIDSSSCMQRMICTYIQQTLTNMKEGTASTVDQLLHSVTNNALFSYMLDGSSIKQAVDMGKRGEECAGLYVKCPITKQNITQLISNLIPA